MISTRGDIVTAFAKACFHRGKFFLNRFIVPHDHLDVGVVIIICDEPSYKMSNMHFAYPKTIPLPKRRLLYSIMLQQKSE